jgi:hypothetical protein
MAIHTKAIPLKKGGVQTGCLVAIYIQITAMIAKSKYNPYNIRYIVMC